MSSNRPKTMKRILGSVRHQKPRASGRAVRAARSRTTNALKHPATGGARQGTKLATVISMLQDSHGATIDALSKATGWQPHSIRGALAGAIGKKLGLKVVSEKVDGVRTYRIES
jgi:Protein of unknown function (DUF3489)